MVLVTGGAGYVGSHVVAALARAGMTPIVLDNFSNSSRGVIARLEQLTDSRVRCIEADVRDAVALRAVFAEYPISAVVHCAGLKAVGESAERPLAYWEVNVGGTLSLAEVMGEAGVATLVFSSSATVYGQPEELPVTEDAPLRPQNVYGRTKRVVEEFLRDLASANSNWRIAILRYFNPAGAHPSGADRGGAAWAARTISCRSCRERRLASLPRSRCSGATGRRPTAPVSATTCMSRTWPRGTCSRSDYLARHAGATTFNLGMGRGFSVLEVIEAFERACGRRLARTFVARRAGDIAQVYADPKRAQNVLGWRAERGLDAICEDAWRWQKSGGRYN